MSESNGDRPAFPFVCDDLSKNQCAYAGMTKREYLAGLAMQGMIAENAHPQSPGSFAMLKEITEKAVEYADALIAELDKERASDKP